MGAAELRAYSTQLVAKQFSQGFVAMKIVYKTYSVSVSTAFMVEAPPPAARLKLYSTLLGS